MRSWNGSQYAWSDRGLPLGVEVETGAITAITAQSSPSATQRTRVFVRGSDGHLWVHWWNGSQYIWSDHGLAQGHTVELGAIGATVVKDAATAPERPYAFVRASNGHLWAAPWTE